MQCGISNSLSQFFSGFDEIFYKYKRNLFKVRLTKKNKYKNINITFYVGKYVFNIIYVD